MALHMYSDEMILEYLRPCAEVLSYSPEGIVCESDTERVGEEDGEW